MMETPLIFQQKLMKKAHSPKWNVIGVSMPRGNGKSWLAARVLDDMLWPKSPHFINGKEVVLLAADLQQARIIFKYLRDWREESGLYRYQDSSNKVGITLPARPGEWKTTKLVTYSSNAKGAMGLVNIPVVVADEPGAWEVNKGQLMADALFTALGKPGSDMRIIMIGTLAPAKSGWWHNLIKDGTNEARRRYVYHLEGNRENWDKWSVIKKANPLMKVDANFRKQVLGERDDARKDPGLKARFLSYRLNLPSGDESEMLLTEEDWLLTLKRPVLEPEGRPVIGVDLGSGRAWSAAVAVWPNGRIEAFAVAPGIPDLEEQEKRDRVPKGTYTALEKAGYLIAAPGLRVQPVDDFARMIEIKWPQAEEIIADRHRMDELRQYSTLVVRERTTVWFQSSEDIRALRKWAKDGPMNIEKGSRKLITASLAVAMIKADEKGNTMLVKRGFNNESRDDVCAAMLLAVGEMERKIRKSSKFIALVC